jgi:hypothetical protein
MANIVQFKVVSMNKNLTSVENIALTSPMISEAINLTTQNDWQNVEITNNTDWNLVFLAYGWDKINNKPKDLANFYQFGVHPIRIILTDKMASVSCCGGRQSAENNIILDVYWKILSKD